MEQNVTSQTGCMFKAIRNIFKSQNRFSDLEVSIFLTQSWFSLGSNCIPSLVHNPLSYCHALVHWETTATTADQSQQVDLLSLGSMQESHRVGRQASRHQCSLMVNYGHGWSRMVKLASSMLTECSNLPH